MKLRIKIEGVSYDVEVEVLEDGHAPVPHVAMPAPVPAASAAAGAAPAPSAPPAARNAAAPAAARGPVGERVCKSPIAGTILDVKVQPGDRVTVNQTILVMEAMKMETNVASNLEGVVKAVHATKGSAVKQGQVLVEFD